MTEQQSHLKETLLRNIRSLFCQISIHVSGLQGTEAKGPRISLMQSEKGSVELRFCAPVNYTLSVMEPAFLQLFPASVLMGLGLVTLELKNQCS